MFNKNWSPRSQRLAFHNVPHGTTTHDAAWDGFGEAWMKDDEA